MSLLTKLQGRSKGRAAGAAALSTEIDLNVLTDKSEHMKLTYRLKQG